MFYPLFYVLKIDINIIYNILYNIIYIYMYSIFFHLSGITILEISFFFYYIGPKETEMFQHHVKLLIKDPLLSIPYDPNNMAIINNLQQNSDDSKLRRETENYNLFIKTIDYWLILVIFSLCVFFIQYKYEEYQKLQKNRGLTIVDNTNNGQSTELIHLQTKYDEPYRKGSIDESDDETNIMLEIPFIDNNKKNSYRNKILHYVTFGSFIILFQYLFFQHIVYYYNPLTINEIKYLIYQDLQPVL